MAELIPSEVQLAAREVAGLIGDPHALMVQLGVADAVPAISSGQPLPPIQRLRDVTALRDFLHRYQSQILYPFELPAIVQAFAFTQQNQGRELLELDRELVRNPIWKELTSASVQVGRSHLRRLRPLRDHRLAQRYLQAVEDGHACGWHTIVYGVILGVYSLPLRQGLISYARQTLGGFIHASKRSVSLSEEGAAELLEELSRTAPAAMESALASQAGKLVPVT